MSLALRLLADRIESERAPSRAAVASDLRDLVRVVGGPDTLGARVALFDTIKKLKRKVFNTRGEAKDLEKVDRLKRLQRRAKPLIKAVREGEDFANVVAEADWVSILLHSAEFMSDGSEVLRDLADAKKSYEVVAALGEMDELYRDNDGLESSDRKVVVDAIERFMGKSEKRIEELEK